MQDVFPDGCASGFPTIFTPPTTKMAMEDYHLLIRDNSSNGWNFPLFLFFSGV